MGKRIVIIDGNSLINRAYYAMQRPMITKEGIYTQGIYGFVNMLHKLEGDYEPDCITVAFDLKAPTFRHLEYDAYKAGRKAMPPELVMQMPLMKEVLHAMNIETLELEGFEADDIIGTVAREAEELGMEPLIITGDKDALQLATDKTKVIITKKGITDFDLFDYDKMLETYQLTPTQFIDLKGLMGDKSDNIPGIPGVGEKTAGKLLEQFGSIENMLANTDQIANAKLRAKVEENAQLAMMSKRLATINRFVPLELDFEKLKKEEPDYPKLIELYTKLEFKSFLKRLDVKEVTAALPETVLEVRDVQKTVISGPEELSVLKAMAGNPVMLKVFGDAGHVNNPVIEGVFLASEDKAYYADWTVNGSALIKILNECSFSFMGHELKDDLYSLMYYGLKNFTTAYDTAIAAYVLDVSRSKYDLKTMAMEQLNLTISSMDEFMADSGQLDLFARPDQKYLDYGVLTMEVVQKLMPMQKNQLAEQGLERVLYEVELPLIEVLASMEVDGVRANAQFLDDFGVELKKQISEKEQEIYQYAGTEFNINSPIQLGDVLFETLKLPAGKKTKRGYSTSADVLEKIRPLHPIVDAVLTYRNLAKLNSTYVEGMKPLICEDGRIRAHFQQNVTTTGRLSCTEPNLQNIPIRQELGRKLRQAFVAADENHTLVGADYSQIELRVLAHLSGDEVLIEAFNNGDDIHKLTASRVLGVPFDDVSLEQRSRAKAVNFGVIYGMSSFGLSEELNISRKEADEYIKEYFRKHEKVKIYMDSRIADCKACGYSETILGRKRMIPEIGASNFMVRQLGERLAMNTPIQGSAADIIKLAMIGVYRELKEHFPQSRLILQVHDELIIDCRNEDLEEVKKLLVRCMESAMNLQVKLAAELNTGYSWYDLK
ncbi:MAG: DNA polymerase I [Firmicutes bacterium]|nr:DNA polymerase I [Bacillota bacterium]